MKVFLAILLFALFIPLPPIFAQEDITGIESDSVAESNMENSLSGMVVDETTTKAGEDFYFLFYTKWEAPVGASDYNIIISEKPLPRLGSQIKITINDIDIFEQFIQSKYDIIDEMTDIAVDIARDFVTNYEDIQRELQGDDLKGSGVF